MQSKQIDNKFLRYIKNGRKWLYLLVVIILIVGASSFIYYYFKIYPPNFSDVSVNFISSDSSGSLKPGDRITYTINYKNTGKKAAEDFAIELKIPENTVFISSNHNDISKNADGTFAFEVGSVKGSEKG